METRTWFAGVDWAKQTHHVRLTDDAGKDIGERVFKHGGEGLADMAKWLIEKTQANAEDIRIAIEVPHGPVVETLMERGFSVNAINPKQLDRFRDRFSVSKPRTTVATRVRSRQRCVPIRNVFATSRRSTRRSWSCASGRGSPMN